MVTIYWVLGQTKSCHFLSYILKKLIEHNPFYEKYPELNPYIGLPDRITKIKLLPQKIGKIIPSGLNIKAKLQKKYIIGTRPKTSKTIINLWQPFIHKHEYFSCDNESLERLLNKIQYELEEFKEYQINHIIPHESVLYFIDWYTNEKVDKLLSDIFLPETSTENDEDNDDFFDKSKKQYKIRQVICFVGDEPDFIKIFEKLVDNLQAKFIFFQENSYNLSRRFKLENKNIKKVELGESFKQLYQLWFKFPRDLEDYIIELNNKTETKGEIESIRMFLMWEELKYSIIEQTKGWFFLD